MNIFPRHLKTACINHGGKGYLEKGKIINPIEVKTFDDGSTWFKIDATIACMVKGTDGTCFVEKA